jgi:hypothetical protein
LTTSRVLPVFPDKQTYWAVTRHVSNVPDSDIGGSPIRRVRDQASARSSLRAAKKKTVSGEQTGALKHIELLVGIHA